MKQNKIKNEKDKTVVEKLLRELLYLVGIFCVVLIIMRGVFHQESFFVIVKVLSGLFWMFILPGYSLTFWWNQKLDFLIRIVVGIGITAAFTAVAGYYLGLIGLHVRYHGILIPSFIISCSVCVNIVGIIRNRN